MRAALAAVCCAFFVACAGEPPAAGRSPDAAETSVQDSTHVQWSVEGLEGPEAVRWDPDQRVWFVANFGAEAEDDRDGNGFISRVGADGGIEELRFMVGSADAPLHMPRGMFIRGDTLWVADVDGIHAFDRRAGTPLAFVDFTALEPGFLNDVAAAPDGPLHVTDSRLGRVYRVSGAGSSPEIAVDSLPHPANGITWSPERSAFLLAPWGDGKVVRSLTPAGVVDSVVTVPSGRFDGIEAPAERILLAAQADSSLWIVEGTVPRIAVRTRGAPADIGYDPVRGLVAVPYIRLNRVDVWEIR